MAVKHIIQHNLSPELARKVTDKAFETYAAKFKDYSPTANWVSPTKSNIGFNAKGISLKGAIELKPSAVELELDVPFLLRPFKDRAVKVIDTEIREWIAKANAGELDEA